MTFPCVLCDRPSEDEPFLIRAGVPVHQNLPQPTRDAALAVPRGDLELVACGGCGLVWNRAFDPSLTAYGAGYDNDQGFSGAFSEHTRALVESLRTEGGSRDRIVEIGCGNGSFLRAVCASTGASGLGLDPSYRGPDEVDGGRVRFRREKLAGVAAMPDRGRANVILCRHVIEHIDRPLDLLVVARELLGPDGVACFETPDVVPILDGVVLYDFFYEHCSYFTPGALTFAFERAGFDDVRVDHVFGGQYMFARARRAEPSARTAAEGGRVPELARRYRARERARVEHVRARLDALAARGPVAVWGAGAKGVTFAGLFDPRAERLAGLVDINPRKQGMFVPGTGHPIFGPGELTARHITDVVVMNPVYLDEVRRAVAPLPIHVHDEATL